MIFKIRKLRVFCINFILLTVLLTGLFIVAKIRSQIGLEWLISLVFFPILLVSSFVMILSLMDIMINELGISRRFLGMTWQSIEWRNVKVIKIFDGIDREQGKITYFNVFPIIPSKFRIVPGGKIIFNDAWMVDFLKFKNIINGYILINKISIERKINGKSVILNKI